MPKKFVFLGFSDQRFLKLEKGFEIVTPKDFFFFISTSLYDYLDTFAKLLHRAGLGRSIQSKNPHMLG